MKNEQTPTSGSRAVVIGGSIAGLLAARVLSDHFEQVTVVERDKLPQGPDQRRGVPQGGHAHALLAGGMQAVEKLFPGFTDDIIDAGAVPGDAGQNGSWFMEGGFLTRVDFGSTGILMSRPFVEAKLRDRVSAVGNIRILDGVSVRGLRREGQKITGINFTGGQLAADLVVDASGRGCLAPKWLAELGFVPPVEEKIEIQLAYTTRMFERLSTHLNGDNFAVVPPTVEGKRGGVVLAAEGERWLVTLWGHFGESAPPELDGFVDYAKSLPAPLIYELVRNAVPLGEPRTIKFPANTRRRYERLRDFPAGYLVFGDAVCSFNPVYGQGMSVSALQAVELQHCLLKGIDGLALRFFNRAARVIDNPWSIAVGGDVRMPEVPGPRKLGVRFINWYMSHLHRAAHSDPAATLAFLRVAQLVDEPASLMSPRIAWKVARQAAASKLRAGQAAKLENAAPA